MYKGRRKGAFQIAYSVRVERERRVQAQWGLTPQKCRTLTKNEVQAKGLDRRMRGEVRSELPTAKR